MASLNIHEEIKQAKKQPWLKAWREGMVCEFMEAEKPEMRNFLKEWDSEEK